MTILLTALGYLYTHVLPFVLLLGILVFVHELGHYLVAIWCGVRVEVFSLGFGKKLFSYKRGHTVYCVSAVPLGGYVKMFGEQGSESVITDEDKKVSFSHKNPWQRIAIVLAGPMMNFLFAVLVFAVISQVGEQTRAPLVAAVTAQSTAEKAGLKAGDRILQVNSQPVRSYEEFQKILNKNKGSEVQALVRDTLGAEKTLTLPVTSTNNPNIFSLESQLGQVEGIEPLAMGTGVGVIPGSAAYKAGIRSGDEIVSVNGEKVRLWTDLENRLQSAKQNVSIEVERPSAELDENDLPKSKSTLKFEIAQKDLKSSLVELGLEQPQLYLGSVVKGSPAAEAGIQPYDKIVAINSKPVTKWLEVLETIKAYDGKEPLNISIVRPQSDNVDQAVAAKTEIVKKVTPKVTEQTTAFGATDKRYTLGIITSMSYAEPEMVKVAASNPIEALVNGTIRTVDVSVMTMMSFVKLFQGQVSPKNLGGMVSIGKVAKDSFEVGPQAFFMTMGILSVSLFILNLMPIPVLDGGHLVFYVIEVIKGSPLSLKKMEIAQQVGFVLLLGLMILAQFNDIVKFLFKS
jgi:regulator of sigma E protease